jgi:cobalamin biosynthesis protein CobD/CbiB
MKKLLNLLQTAAAHVNIICAGMILTFLVIEVFFNPYAGFINHSYTKIVLSVWVAAALLTSIFSIAAQRSEFRRRQREAARRRREREARRGNQ